MTLFHFSTSPNEKGNPQPSPVPQPRRRGCMRRLMIGLLIYFIFCGIFGAWMGNMFSTPVTELKDNTIYKLELRGKLVEQGNSTDPFMAALSELPGVRSEHEVGLDEILSNIRLAKEDKRILGIYLSGGELQVSPASAKQIRDALLDFKQSGKWIVAYATSYGQLNYYIASVADCISADPTCTVSWNGLTAEKMYYTRLMEKIGVEMQIIKVGTYKSAVEPFFRTSMSPEDRAQTEQYVQGIWAEIEQAVSASRHLSVDTLEQYADRYMGLESAEECHRCGLVDTLVYQQQMDSVLRTWAGVKDYHLENTSAMACVARPESKAKDEIAVLYADGQITDSEGDGIVGDAFIKTIRQILKRDETKALVIRVNSPGGSADASERIWGAIRSVKDKGIPVVVTMSDYAASGGYYISCGADYIYAEPTTITGSIGIFGTIPNLNKLRDKVGLDVDGIKTNAHSDLEANMIYRGMNPEETQMMQRMVERGYDLFTRRCAEGRGISQDSIKAIAEGRVWLGKDALRLGLVDSLGGMQDAIDKAASLAKLEGYKLTYYPEQEDTLDEILRALSGEESEEEQVIAYLRTWAKKSRVMALMPTVEIK